MANVLDISNLTLNAKESEAIRDFVIEASFKTPELAEVFNVVEGIKMKEQIVKIGQMSLAGVEAGSTCAVAQSGATIEATQKYWEPVQIEDRLEVCQKQVNQLFKAYYNQIKTYKDLYNIEGSDEQALIATMIAEAIKASIQRLAWFGDKDVAKSTASASGVKDDDDIKFYSPVDGIFKQIAESSAVKTVDLTSLQGATITGAQAYKAIMDVYKKADPRTRASVDGEFLVSGDVFMGLQEYAINNSLNFEYTKFENGIQALKVLGFPVFNMENAWRYNALSFEATTAGEVDKPTRIIFTPKSNLGLGTLSVEDMAEVTSFYDNKDRVNYSDFGYTIDPKIISDELLTIGW